MHGESLGYTDGKLLGSYEGITLGLFGGKFIGTIVVNVDEITLGIDNGSNLWSLYGCFGGSNDGNLEVYLYGDSLVYTGGKVLGSGVGINLKYTDGKVLGTLPGNIAGNILGIYVGTELGYLDGSFDGYNDDKLKEILHVDSLIYTHGKLIGTVEGIRLRSTDGRVLGTILGNVTWTWCLIRYGLFR